MLYKTRGIILHHIPYSDSSIIVKIFTEQFGMSSCILQGLKGEKKSLRNFLSNALTLVNLDIYYKETRAIQRIKEVSAEASFSRLPFDPLRRQYALCVAEIIFRTVREEEPNQALYDFIRMTVIDLDAAPVISTHFTLLFLIRLSRYLGFYPQNNYSPALPCFDLRDGKFIAAPAHTDCVPPPLSSIISSLVAAAADDNASFLLPADQRKGLTAKIIHYYHIHLPGMHRIRSLEMTDEVIADLS